MKFFKRFLFKFILFLFIIGIIMTFIFGIIGFNSYSNALKEKRFLDRISEITTNENFVPFSNLSKDYINAVIAVEDHRFYNHGALDFISIARAFYTNLSKHSLKEGGSTITQQVAKNVFFSQEKTLSRKLGEIFASIDLEKNYSKDEIFTFYVNTSYFGDGFYGIKEASNGYYQKDPIDLTLDEASMLAGIPNAPSVYSPTKNPELAKQRQAQVLERMVKYKYISQETANEITSN